MHLKAKNAMENQVLLNNGTTNVANRDNADTSNKRTRSSGPYSAQIRHRNTPKMDAAVCTNRAINALVCRLRHTDSAHAVPRMCPLDAITAGILSLVRSANCI